MAEESEQHRLALDVSRLPDVTFATRSITWWGTIGMTAIEGGVFALVIACYFYLRSRADLWPPTEAPPDLLWGSLNTGAFLLSLIPTEWYRRRAHKGDLGAVRVGLVLAGVIGAVILTIRYFELRHLNCNWSGDAYGSVVWLLMGLHTTHLLTDWVETLVLTALLFTPHLVEGKRFVDAEENASYWYFVVITWIPIYLVLYWAPRWL